MYLDFMLSVNKQVNSVEGQTYPFTAEPLALVDTILRCLHRHWLERETKGHTK